MGPWRVAARSGARKSSRRVSAVIAYELRDATGMVVAIHERRDEPGGAKRFIWRQPDGTLGLTGTPVSELPLFGINRLDGLTSTVVVTEGEKACQALLDIGVAAVGTVTGAATAPCDRVLAELGGREVLLWPDADAIGRTHMATIAERLTDIAASVRIVEPPEGVEAGWDAADAVAEGRDIAALLARPPIPSLGDTLDRIEAFLRRYVVFARPEVVVAIVLWVAHTHALEYADATPYLAITSPEKQSGKTRLLECLALLAHGSGGIVVTPTASTIYRTLEATPGATLLLDELDAVFRDRSDRYEEVRAVINAGHRRGATVPRSVSGPKNTWVVKQFAVFGPKALAGIGALPDTVADRAIPIRMLKRKRDEPVARFRYRTGQAEAASVVAALATALKFEPPADEADIPAELPDRAGDVWEPLLAIADAARGAWPRRARSAAVILHGDRSDDESLGLRLLADIRVVFLARAEERIATAQLIEALAADEESPWADAKVPLTPHRIGRLLRPYGITSKQVRIGSLNVKGYERAAFTDVWDRYLPLPSSPVGSQHRNSEHDRRFDVSDRNPMESDGGMGLVDLPVELDYPRSTWDVDSGDVRIADPLVASRDVTWPT